jgi:hypothetical protein
LPEFDSASGVGSLKRMSETRPAADAEKFLVFRVTKVSDAELPLPFVQHKGQEFVGVSVPSDSAAAAKKFFSVGRSYAYTIGNESAEIEVQAAFDSRAEAAAAYPEVGKTWYTLSPYEIMNLGQGPWISR